MAILIKGLKMPDRCDECPFASYQIGSMTVTCKAANVQLKKFWQGEDIPRAAGCPLVEVPQPDKIDLVSRQTLIDTFKEEFYMMYLDSFNDLLNFFHNLPGVVDGGSNNE